MPVPPIRALLASGLWRRHPRVFLAVLVERVAVRIASLSGRVFELADWIDPPRNRRRAGRPIAPVRSRTPLDHRP
jgi:hypothetical protein